ncbi:hypothetical protein KJ969_00555 [Patescibacteria group bacterium]|nr:hypothetical protein [Patescibacteria group bacterium]MBU1922398.1 hypothetical protein [Patescibacteria group bacterium]
MPSQKKSKETKKTVKKKTPAKTRPRVKQTETRAQVEPVKNVSQGRQELDRIINQEVLNDRIIFSDVKPKVPVQEKLVSREKIGPDNDVEERIYETEEPVTLYRRVLLWSSVGLCGVIICFGWFLTVGGTLGFKNTGQAQQVSPEIGQMSEDLKDEFNSLKDIIKENTDKASIEDATLKELVEGIKNATTTQEINSDEDRDIFSPPEE